LQTFNSITDARNAIMDFPISDLPEKLRPKFRELRGSPSPVDQIVRLGEFLYANRVGLTDEAWSLAGGLISFGAINAWHMLNEDSRGDRIVQAIRRDMGETPPAGTSFPPADQDPAPLPEYAPVVPPADVTA